MVQIIPNWHPIFVHFTVALLSLAVLFSLAGMFLREGTLKEQWLILARWDLWLGSAFAIVTALAGWDAYNTVAHDAPSHAAMTEHRNWALTTLFVFVLLSVWSIWNHRKQRKAGALFAVILLAGGVLLASTAWHGGEVVYRYGLGVMSLPNVEGEGHDDHGDAHGHDHEAGPTAPSAAAATSYKGVGAEHESMPVAPASELPAQPLETTKPKNVAKPHNHDGHTHPAP
jgi:uncharacterized membrane protein